MRLKGAARLRDGLMAWAMAMAAPAAAQAPAKAPDPDWDPLARVLAAADFGGWAGTRLRAVLTQGEPGDADLHLFALAEGPDLAPRRILLRRGFAFSTPAPGQMAGLAVNERDSLVIVSRNETTGRERWELRVTVAVRDGAPVVAGMTLTTRDTLAARSDRRCDINFLTGRGTVNGRAVATGTQAPELMAWPADAAEQFCK